MFPLLPFAAGLLTGAAAIKLLKAGKTKATLGKVQDGLRNATVSSLAVIENSSANLRSKLMSRPVAAADQTETAEPQAQPAAAPEIQKTARRKPAAKTGQTAAPRARRRKAEEGAP